jgi:hypothetical protein
VKTSARPAPQLYLAADETPSQGGVTVEEARQLTSEQRLAMVRQGSLIFDGLRQARFLAGLIPALSKLELEQAIKIMGDAQGRGNHAAQDVWDALWTQAGRVDAERVLAGLAANPSGKTRSDMRHIMEGWLESDPAAAEAWARKPGKFGVEAQAAAAVISQKAAGDLSKFQAALTALPEGDEVRRDALMDFFDLASANGLGDAAAVYETLPPSLKKDGWSAALQQISFGEPQTAVDWLTKHAGEPGTNYRFAFGFIHEIARDDPAAATAWVATLPEADPADGASGDFHPAALTYSDWRRKDAAAAEAWLAQQPETKRWVVQLRQHFSPRPQ